MRALKSTAIAVALFALGTMNCQVAVAQEPNPDRCPGAVHASAQPTPVADRPHPLAHAHRFATGKGVKVAVIDTGVAKHPRLGHVASGGDFVEPGHSTAGADQDCDGHGTIVAGIIAARPGPDSVIGLAPDAEVISIRQTSAFLRRDDKASGTIGTLASAIDRALDQGAHIINISVVSCFPTHKRGSTETQPLERALARAETQGAVVVAAAGNIGQSCEPDSVVYPAHSPTVVAVAASSDTHHLADYSVPVEGVFVSAPGTTEIGLSPRSDGLVTAMAGAQGPVPFVGTSFAAPRISGILALLKEHHPSDSPAQLRRRLIDVASPGTNHIDPTQALGTLAASESTIHQVNVSQPLPQSNQAQQRALAVLTIVLVAGVLGGVSQSLVRGISRH